MGGSFLCCSNFLLNLSPKLFCSFEEGSGGNNLLLFFIIFCLLAFPALLPPDHHEFSQGHPEWWGKPEHHPRLTSIHQYQLNPLGLCCGIFAFLITVALKATFLPHTTAAYLLLRCSLQEALSVYFFPCDYSIHHHTFSDDLHWLYLPMIENYQSFAGAPRSLRLLSHLLAHCILADWSPALLTAFPSFTKVSARMNQLFLFYKQSKNWAPLGYRVCMTACDAWE